ncbi:MAG: pyridoxamine 5'-phosphate oxidase family protein [Rhodospirillales bacterium]
MGIGKRLTPQLRDFIEGQRLFFVATAAPGSRVNLSPKGMDSLRVITCERIVWMNLTGSGNETAAHVAEDGRMTLMFCAFEDPPLILRVYGRARVLHPDDRGWEAGAGLFPPMAGQRNLFDLAIDQVQTSCGTGVPVMPIQRERGPEDLLPYYEEMGPEGVARYWRRKNRRSLDGRPTGILPEERPTARREPVGSGSP